MIAVASGGLRRSRTGRQLGHLANRQREDLANLQDTRSRNPVVLFPTDDGCPGNAKLGLELLPTADAFNEVRNVHARFVGYSDYRCQAVLSERPTQPLRHLVILVA